MKYTSLGFAIQDHAWESTFAAMHNCFHMQKIIQAMNEIKVFCPKCKNTDLRPSNHRLYGLYCPQCKTLGHLSQGEDYGLIFQPDSTKFDCPGPYTRENLG